MKTLKIFTPLEKAIPTVCLDETAGLRRGGKIPSKACGGVIAQNGMPLQREMPPLVSTLRKRSSLTGFTLLLFGLIIFINFAETAESNSKNLIKAEEYYQIGRAYLANGEYDKANAEFQKAQDVLKTEKKENFSKFTIKERPAVNPDDNEEVVSNTAANEDIIKEAKKAYEGTKIDDALYLYQQALQLTPQDYNLHYNLGVIYLDKSDFFNAAEEFKIVISLHQSDADAYYNLGIIYEGYLNNSKLALKYYKKYLKFAPDSKEAVLIKRWIREIKNK